MTGVRRAVVFGGLVLWLAQPAPGAAQPAAEPRLAVSVGPEWLGRTPVGGRDATLTRNPSGSSPYFSTDSRLAGGIGFSGALGLRLAHGVWTEVTGRYHSARLSTRVTSDVEARDQSATEAVQYLAAEVGVLWSPAAWEVGRRVRFHAAGGGGYLRQLHASNTLAETGRSYYAGGGAVVTLPQRQGGTFKAAGVRIDIRAAAIERGVAFDDRLHVAPAVTAALLLRF